MDMYGSIKPFIISELAWFWFRNAMEHFDLEMLCLGACYMWKIFLGERGAGG